MHRDGFIIEEIIQDDNMNEAFDCVLGCKGRKKSISGRRMTADRQNVIDSLKKDIEDGSFSIDSYKEKTITEFGKVRNIKVVSLVKRIGLCAIMNVVDRHIHRRYIRTTGASIKKRGMHDIVNCIVNDMKKDPDGTTFFYKFDIRKFYDTVDQDTVMASIRHCFKDKRLINILERAVRMTPTGIGTGLRTSQGLLNLLLSVNLDHEIKDKYGFAHYYRYCDDGLIACATKGECWNARNIVHELIEKIGLEVKGNERVFPLTEGIDFLGYVIYNDHIMLRKRVKKNTARKLHNIKSRRRSKEVIASFYGMAKHADCNNLFYKLTEKNMNDLFKDLKKQIPAYKTPDGKKRFRGKAVSIKSFLNKEITVVDYEKDVKTEHGERHLVSVDDNGELKKFFTDDKEMKFDLEQLEKMGKIPFVTTIGWDDSDGFGHYVFT